LSAGVEGPAVRLMSDQLRELIDRAMQAQQERRFADAQTAWTAAVEQLREHSDRPALAHALRSLGEACRKLHDSAAARAHYEEAVAVCRLLGDPLALAHTVRHLGDVYYQAKELALAEPCYHEALDLYRAHPEAGPLDVANAIRSMALLKSKIGAAREARELWAEARQLYAANEIEAGVTECSQRLAELALETAD
jgi:tetratricopeptide (TPR) repeat protein